MWQDVLGEVGVAVETVDAEHVRLRSEEGDQVFRLHRFHRPLSTCQLPDPGPEPSLLAVLRMTPKTMQDARRMGWSVVTDVGAVSLHLGASRLERTVPEVPEPTAARRGPVPWATFTVVRRLLAVAPVTQVELAGLVGVGQPRVSRILGMLRGIGLVEQAASGWRPADWDGLVNWWLAHYRGPAGVTSYWYSLDDVATQAARVLQVLAGVPEAAPVVSGDAAADLLAPWRRPEYLTVYVKAATSLASAGFVPVGSPVEATLTLCAAKDPGVWLPEPWIIGGVPVADPLQVAHDLTSSPAVDSDEAVAQLWQALRTRHADAWRTAAGGRR